MNESGEVWDPHNFWMLLRKCVNVEAQDIISKHPKKQSDKAWEEDPPSGSNFS